MKKIAIIGAGGFGKEVFCIWRDFLEFQNEPYHFVGFFDDSQELKENSFGKVVGKIEDLNTISESIEVVIAVGNVNYLKKIFERITNPNIIFPNIIHPSVSFFDTKNLMGRGNILSSDCIISCDVVIGNFNIFNTRVTLGHDVEVGDYNVFSPNTQISGTVKIQNQNFFGFNCGVIQGRKIGSNNTIGAGSILLRSIKDDSTYMGNPAIKIKF